MLYRATQWGPDLKKKTQQLTKKLNILLYTIMFILHHTDLMPAVLADEQVMSNELVGD